MENHCNLLDRAWIDVIDHQGIESRVGVRALLRDASDYRALAAPLGTVNFAVLRMVEAILYRAWDSRKWRNLDNAIEHWQEKWDQETLFDDAVVGYLEQWQDRFDIRDAEHPFFQVAGLHTTRGEWKSLDILVPDVGDAGDLYTMRSGLDSVDAAEAAQMLVHCMAFDFSGIKSGVVGDARVKGGKGFPIGIGWCGWLGGTVVEGRNLRETLLLNYVPHREEAGGGELPPWGIGDIRPGRPLPNSTADRERRHRPGGIADLAAATSVAAVGGGYRDWRTDLQRRPGRVHHQAGHRDDDPVAVQRT